MSLRRRAGASAAGERVLDWDRDAGDWPLREHSRFVEAAGLRWHVQRLGQGPPILLLHGTGASAHSWHAVAKELAGEFELVVPDLPGHGFTQMPAEREAFTLPGMARRLAALLAALAIEPRLVAGHSAGAAILCRMAIEGTIAPLRLVSVNGALLPFRTPLRGLYALGARLLAAREGPAAMIARRARTAHTIDRMIRESGSSLSAREVGWYERLAGSPQHVRAALRMMAGWDLVGLERDLPLLPVPLVVVQAVGDRFVRPEEARRVARLAPTTETRFLEGVGHLAHEERPAELVGLLRRVAREPE